MQTKNEIRKRLLERRRLLAPSDVAARSAAVRERLWTLPAFISARQFFCYVSAKDNEVDTRCIINRLLADGRQVACPTTVADRKLEWRLIRSMNDLVAGAFGIPEPKADACKPVTPEQSAVVLVPGIAFSRIGDRIGYGAGYIDRFLATCVGTSIGLAYDFQVVEMIPHEDHDRRVDFVATESAIYSPANAS